VRQMISFLSLAVAMAVSAAQLRPEASSAFDHFAAENERRIQAEERSPNSFLDVDALDVPSRLAARERLQQGDLLIRKLPSPANLAGALVHHWIGTIFIPRATVAQTLALVQDYDHLDRYYAPEVMRSRLLARNDSNFRIAMRLRKKEVETIVLDSEYSVEYGRLDSSHVYSFSRSTRISEIENPGESNERALEPGHDDGFLWRLNTYWRFAQEDDGVLVECEALSLTRDVPTGLGWLVNPFIENIPRESLRFTLTATRKAVLERVTQQNSKGESDVSKPNDRK
jgi:hypothetical protein